MLGARSNNASVGGITGSIGCITEAIRVCPIEEEEDKALAMKKARSVSQMSIFPTRKPETPSYYGLILRLFLMDTINHYPKIHAMHVKEEDKMPR